MTETTPPIGSLVWVHWGSGRHRGTVTLHGISDRGQFRFLVWLFDWLSEGKGVYRWFDLGALR